MKNKTYFKIFLVIFILLGIVLGIIITQLISLFGLTISEKNEREMKIFGIAIVVLNLFAVSALFMLLYKKTEKNDKINFSVILVLLVIDLFMNAVLVFLLFPRRYSLLDGGTIIYESSHLGAIYSVEQLHELYSNNGYSSYTVGTKIYIFEKEIYNSAHVDYDHGSYVTYNQEEMERIESEISSFLAG